MFYNGKINDVFMYLVKYGPRTKSALYHKLKLHRNTISRIDTLVQGGMLIPVQKGNHTEFHLTEKGFFNAIRQGGNLDWLPNSIKIWHDLCPKILLAWDQLSQNLGEKRLEGRTLMAALDSEIITSYFKIKLKPEGLCGSDQFTIRFINPFLTGGDRSAREQFMLALGKVPDLKAEVLEKLTVYEEMYESMVEEVRHLQHMLEEL